MEILKRIISSIILIPLCIYLIIEGSIFFNIFIILCFFITIYEWFNLIKKSNYKIFGIFFIILSFYTFYRIRNEFGGEYINILFILISCISTDIGGLVFGKIFKGPKLTKISPNKTYSGVVGGYIFAIFSIYIFSVYPNTIINPKFTNEIIIYTFLISTISQMGDLVISYFKRKSDVKDTGKIIPGHGGILDRIDGMLFVFPFCYILLSLNMINILK
tara:strand:- start:372 stop:1022 length:651 start_codon:yes stop_codon:yes gene_type:complete